MPVSLTMEHPRLVLLRVLDASSRGSLWVSAGLLVVERLGVAGLTERVVRDGWDRSLYGAVGLGIVVLGRAGLRARLRLRVRKQVVEALALALLSEGPRLSAGIDRDAEFALVDGMYATEELLAQRVPELFGDLVACVVLAVSVVAFAPARLVLEGGAAAVLLAGIVLGARGLTSRTAQRVWDAFMPALDHLATAIHARLEIVANGDERPFLRTLTATLRAWEARSSRGAWVSFLAGRAPLLSAAALAAVVLASHGASPSSVALVLAVAPAFAALARGTLDLGRDRIRAKPVVACLDAARHPPLGGNAAPHLPATITVAALCFAYPGDAHSTLTDVDLTWQPGTLLALGGQNGSGKSTFVRILMGLHQATSGRVQIGDVSLTDIDRAALRGRLGYLAQRPFLPDRMTVAQAIHLLAPDALTPAIHAMLTRLGLFSVLARRRPSAPLDVKLGALSAGEKQRVAIARVVLRDAPLLFLDEPDANLDAEGIAVVREVLREEAKTRMVLVIAHSPALLAAADRVIQFESGRIRTV